MIRPIVIIHVRIVASRARRDDVRRPTTNMNIQGGMTFRLMSPHSRLKERHEGKEKEKERERARRARGRKKKNRSWSQLSLFSRPVNKRGCLWVREEPA